MVHSSTSASKSGPTPFLADRNKRSRVIKNLVGNAAKYSAMVLAIKISSTLAGDQLLVSRITGEKTGRWVRSLGSGYAFTSAGGLLDTPGDPL